jgi:hypothetical protein
MVQRQKIGIVIVRTKKLCYKDRQTDRQATSERDEGRGQREK